MSDDAKIPDPPRRVFGRPARELLEKPYAELSPENKAAYDAWIKGIVGDLRGTKPEVDPHVGLGSTIA